MLIYSDNILAHIRDRCRCDDVNYHDFSHNFDGPFHEEGRKTWHIIDFVDKLISPVQEDGNIKGITDHILLCVWYSLCTEHIERGL